MKKPPASPNPTIGGTPFKEGFPDRLKTTWPPSAAKEQLDGEICISKGSGKTETNIYILACDPYNGRCKIGMAKDLEKNILNLNKKSGLFFHSLSHIPCCCENHARIVKRALDRALETRLEQGQREWYVLSREDLSYVASIMSRAASLPRRTIKDKDEYLVPDVEWLRSIKAVVSLIEL